MPRVVCNVKQNGSPVIRDRDGLHQLEFCQCRGDAIKPVVYNRFVSFLSRRTLDLDIAGN